MTSRLPATCCGVIVADSGTRVRWKHLPNYDGRICDSTIDEEKPMSDFNFDDDDDYTKSDPLSVWVLIIILFIGSILSVLGIWKLLELLVL